MFCMQYNARHVYYMKSPLAVHMRNGFRLMCKCFLLNVPNDCHNPDAIPPDTSNYHFACSNVAAKLTFNSPVHLHEAPEAT
jgi:hypothetical protein